MTSTTKSTSPLDNAPVLLTQEEVAEYLRMPVRTLEDWRADRAKNPGPPYSRAGRRVYYFLDEVVEWLKNNRG